MKEFSIHARHELAELSPSTQREIIAWIRNNMQIVVGTNDMESNDIRLHPTIRANARQRNRSFQLALEALEHVFFGPVEAS